MAAEPHRPRARPPAAAPLPPPQPPQPPQGRHDGGAHSAASHSIPRSRGSRGLPASRLARATAAPRRRGPPAAPARSLCTRSELAVAIPTAARYFAAVARAGRASVAARARLGALVPAAVAACRPVGRCVGYEHDNTLGRIGAAAVEPDLQRARRATGTAAAARHVERAPAIEVGARRREGPLVEGEHAW
eukprot:scaffold119619_cov61-Phaeocystis_antarctica.AAC.3